MVHLRPERPVVSFTFDDFPRSAHSVGGRILQEAGARGTYYVALGLMNQRIPAGDAFSREDLEAVVADGHELGCHTYDHCHAWNTPATEFERSVLRNREELERLLPGNRFESLSYPVALPRPATKRRVARLFPCCRSGGWSFNLGEVDAVNLQAIFLEKTGEDRTAMERLMQENARAGGWLILATHDVDDHPTVFGCTPAYFRDVVQMALDSGAEVLPVGRAWQRVRLQAGG